MKKRRRKRLPKKITGLTWLQKLAIEGVIEFAVLRSKYEDAGIPEGPLGMEKPFRKLLVIFRKKTKHMKPPRQRRKRKKIKAKFDALHSFSSK